jgi:hypothetical protein
MNLAAGMPDIDDPSRYEGQDMFTYTIGIASGTTLAPAGTTTLTFNVDGESDFFWDKATVNALIANDGTSWSADEKPAVYVTIVDTNSQRPMMNNPTPVGNLFGTGQLPFILPIRKLFYSKATVKLTLQNFSDNKTYTQLDFSFIGIKAFLK